VGNGEKRSVVDKLHNSKLESSLGGHPGRSWSPSSVNFSSHTYIERKRKKEKIVLLINKKIGNNIDLEAVHCEDDTSNRK
jgi:hypothetical protein